MMTRLGLMIGLVCFGVCVVSSAAAQTTQTSVKQDGPRFVTSFELGFLDVLSHKIQFGRDGTDFDYVKSGGQDVLFSFVRLSGTFSPSPRHHIKLLYQPLELPGRVRLYEDLTTFDVTFDEGSTIDATYGFPFYRASYMYDVAPSEALEISLGGSLQIRNATITFTSVDGQKRSSQRDVGPVPLLKARVRYDWDQGYWVGMEVDGIYAPISYLNGSDNEVVGALLDASVRAGYKFNGGLEAFLNLRYLGGGAEGQSDDGNDPGEDGYNKNWLHFAVVSLGVNFDWTNGFLGNRK